MGNGKSIDCKKITFFWLFGMLRLRSASLVNGWRAAVTCGRPLSSSPVLEATIGIRREDKSRWERRVPLSPDHVQALVEQGIDVIVQPSSLRIFDNESYIEVSVSLPYLELS